MTDDELLARADAVAANAYAPYSNFHVGAAILTRDGRVFDGVIVDLIYLNRLVRPGGVVMLDDYQLPGVARAASFSAWIRAFSAAAAARSASLAAAASALARAAAAAASAMAFASAAAAAAAAAAASWLAALSVS